LRSDLLFHFVRWLLAILIPIGLLIGAVTILTSDVYVSFEYAKPGFPADTFGFSPADRLRHAIDNIQYLRNGYPPSFLAEQYHDETPLYSQREISHMEDVQAVFQGTWTTGLIVLFLILILTGILFSYRPYQPLFFAALEAGGMITAAAVTLIGLFAILGWNLWFTTFHQIFFQPGTWTFAMLDTLIRLFPINFWFDSALTVTSLTLISGLITFTTGKYFRERSRLALQ
jgi:integral membrane protein (TIGR01906 family)